MNAVRNKAGPVEPAMAAPPEEAEGSRHMLGLGRLALRIVLALTALAVLASPFAVAFYLHYQAQWVGPQIITAPVRFPPAQLSRFRRAALAAVHAPATEPIILAYHDISPHSISQYVVSPAAFEAQMAMLHAAGYHTLTARQLVAYARGGPAPGRSVAITFDDGTRGLWTYADKILARYHFHGISFLITGRVGTHYPYYLTWQEIHRMYASGRWDFGSHTDDLHQQVPVSASGAPGDPLIQLTWLPGEHRRETLPEFRRRVRQDLNDSIADMTEDGLARPQLFAYPFSDSLGAPPYGAAGYANRLVRRLFAIAMTNYIDPAVPFSRREAASGGEVSRLEVVRSDTATTLFDQMQTTAGLPVAGATAVLRSRARWEGEGGKSANITIVHKTIRLTGTNKRWAYAAFDPRGTADWGSYAVAAQIANLNRRVNPTATLSVRVGSRSQLNVSVSNHYVEVKLGGVSSGAMALARPLPIWPVHRVTIQVGPRLTVVSVDGRTVMRKPVAPGPLGTGGIALSGFCPNPHQAFPSFQNLSVWRLKP